MRHITFQVEYTGNLLIDSMVIHQNCKAAFKKNGDVVITISQFDRDYLIEKGILTSDEVEVVEMPIAPKEDEIPKPVIPKLPGI